MKIVCIGRNYAEHAKELGNEIPAEPVIFMKPKSALLQVHTPFYYPEFSNELHYEAELVLRVSKNVSWYCASVKAEPIFPKAMHQNIMMQLLWALILQQGMYRMK